MAPLGLLIAILLFVAGLIGTALPLLPGAPLLWAGMLVYGLFTGFAGLNWTFYLGQALLVVLVEATDYLALAMGVRHYGGSKLAGGAALAGGLVGLILFGPFGLLVGAFILAVLAELLRGVSPSEAWRAGFGSMVGCVGGLLAKYLIEAAMLVWFFVKAF